MNPLTFILFAYLLLGVQLGLADLAGWGAFGPELTLLGVVFIALRARAEAAIFGAMLLGLGRDLIGAMPPGLFVVGYGLVAVATVRVSRQLLPGAPLVHAGLALAGSILCWTLAALLARLRTDVPLPPASAMLVSTLATTAAAPPLLALLGACRKPFEFRKRSFDPR